MNPVHRTEVVFNTEDLLNSLCNSVTKVLGCLLYTSDAADE